MRDRWMSSVFLCVCLGCVCAPTPGYGNNPAKKHHALSTKDERQDLSGWHALSAHLGLAIVTTTTFGIAEAAGGAKLANNTPGAALLISSLVGATSVSAVTWFGIIKLAETYRWSPRWGWILNGGMMAAAYSAIWSHSLAWYLTGPRQPSPGTHVGLVLGGVVLGGLLGGGLNALFLKTSVKPTWYTIGAWLGLVVGVFCSFPMISALNNAQGNLRVADNYFITASVAAGGALGGGLLGFLLGYMTTPRRRHSSRRPAPLPSTQSAVQLGQF